MTPATQAKILRAAESGQIERLGATAPVPVDVRIIAATHQDLPTAIREGRFRQDLYFRLAGMTLRLPEADVPMALEPIAAAGSSNEPYFQARDYREARRLFEAEYLARKLREHGGNVTRTAAAIGVERQSLQEKIKQLGIERD